MLLAVWSSDQSWRKALVAGRGVVELRLIDVLYLLLHEWTDLGEELFGGKKIIEKYWKLMEKLNIEIPISTAVLNIGSRRCLILKCALNWSVLYTSYFIGEIFLPKSKLQPPEPDTNSNEATTDTGGRAILADSDSNNSSDDDDIFDGAGGIGRSE